MKKNKKNRFLTNAAIIAALYVVLTYLTSLLGLASGVIQCRLSEALCILPVFTPAAIPGLFVGCIISNVLTGSSLIDVVFGSIATLLGAYVTYMISKKGLPAFVYSLPTVFSNTLIIPFVLKFAYGYEGSLLFFVATVGAGEIISCTIFGTVLYFSLRKHSEYLFK